MLPPYPPGHGGFYGRFRLSLITRAASAFSVCDDWTQGIARIRCPECGYDLFRPFSCKSFFLCPSCAQKRTLLLGEYLSEDLLLHLPHRQFVWTLPRVLRGFLQRDRTLFAEVGRRTVIGLFLEKGLLNLDFAGKLLSWRHSGFSIESATRIYDQQARVALSQYVLRGPLSLEKIHWDEEQDTVGWKSAPKGYFKGKERHFSCLDFIAQVTLHIPPTPGYSSPAPLLSVRLGQQGDLERSACPQLPRPCAVVRAATGTGSRLNGRRGASGGLKGFPPSAEIRKIVACLAKKGRAPPAQ